MQTHSQALSMTYTTCNQCKPGLQQQESLLKPWSCNSCLWADGFYACCTTDCARFVIEQVTQKTVVSVLKMALGWSVAQRCHWQIAHSRGYRRWCCPCAFRRRLYYNHDRLFHWLSCCFVLINYIDHYWMRLCRDRSHKKMIQKHCVDRHIHSIHTVYHTVWLSVHAACQHIWRLPCSYCMDQLCPCHSLLRTCSWMTALMLQSPPYMVCMSPLGYEKVHVPRFSERLYTIHQTQHHRSRKLPGMAGQSENLPLRHV